MRLFIAINFSDETRSQLLSLQEELRGKSKRGNFTDPENLHLTLAFLGECNTTQTIAIKSAMDGAAFEPFDIAIDYVGRFKRDGGDLWWAGVQKNADLAALHGRLTDKLMSAGFLLGEQARFARRKFSPHITLGRGVAASVRPHKVPPFGETVGAIDLMKSERPGGDLTYTSIYRCRSKTAPTTGS